MFSFRIRDREGEEKEETVVEKTTPLSIAINNNRSCNIILNFMAKIDYNASSTISDIIDVLIDNSSFVHYFENLPF